MLNQLRSDRRLQPADNGVGTVRAHRAGHAHEGSIRHLPQPLRARAKGALGHLAERRARHDDLGVDAAPAARCCNGEPERAVTPASDHRARIDWMGEEIETLADLIPDSP